MSHLRIAVNEVTLELPEDLGQIPDLEGREWHLIATGVHSTGDLRKEGDPLPLKATQVILHPAEKMAPAQETVLDRAVQARARAMGSKLLRTMRPQLRKLEGVFKELEGMVDDRRTEHAFVRVVVATLAETRLQSEVGKALTPYLMPRAEEEILGLLSKLEDDE